MAEVIRIAESASEAATPALPQNVEAEAALLGALMIDNRLVEDIQLKLKPLHFFEPLHGRIYEAILKLTDSNRIANPVTLKPLFDADEGMKEGGAEGKAKSFGEAAMESIRNAEAALNRGGGLTGMTTGFTALNSRIGGLQRSDLIIVAGRPGMGKSALATNMGFAAAERFLQDQSDGIEPARAAGAPVAIFSLEMSAEQLATRILAEQSQVTAEQIRTGNLQRQEFASFARTADRLNSLPLYIDDTPGLTIAALRARARRLKRQKGIGLVVVDYLQLLQGSGKGSAGDNRVQEISEISRGLKQLAKELDLPVVALSQLSRAVEQREDKRPQLSDLRESGSIEQDADIVLFIYREEYYLAARQPADDHPEIDKWREEMARVYGLAEVIVAKQRHGSTGKVRLKFDSRITKFSDLVDEGYMTELRS